MSWSAVLLLAFFSLPQVRPSLGVPLSSEPHTDKPLELVFHYHVLDDPADVVELVKEEHVRKPRDTESVDPTELPKCSLEVTSELFYQNTPVSCPMLTELKQHVVKNDTTELGFIVDPLAGEVNATANVSIGFVKLAIPLRMQCVLWFNTTCSSSRNVLPCDLAGQYGKPEVSTASPCSPGQYVCTRYVPFNFTYLILGLVLMISLFVALILRMVYDLVCFKCFNRRQRTNVTVTFNTEEHFDILMEKEYKKFSFRSQNFAEDEF